MDDPLQNLLDRKIKERDEERTRVAEILRECAIEHVHPAHDYWNRLNDLEHQVKILEKALTNGL